MAIDLSALSAKELDVLINQAKTRKTALKKRKPIATVRNKLAAMAQSEGYTLAELLGGTTSTARAPRKAAAARKSPTAGRKLGKVPPKYRNPAVPTETWTGRGKQPRWLAEQVKKGKKAEDFLIKKAK